MKYAVANVQGFLSGKRFIPKEFSMKLQDDGFLHMLVKTPISWNDLHAKEKRTVVFLMNKYHNLQFDNVEGEENYVTYGELTKIIENVLIDGIYDKLYVKGYDTERFMRDIVSKIYNLRRWNQDEASNLKIINLENFQDCPKVTKDFNDCTYHMYPIKCVCSKINVLNLYNYVNSFLP